MTIKQVIVVRKDLNIRKGKLAAQVAHASFKIFADRNIGSRNLFYVLMNKDMQEWLNGNFAKIVVGCETEAELLALQQQAKSASLPQALITDAGLTEFNGVPTITCLAIGPAKAEEIDKVTAHLTLL